MRPDTRVILAAHGRIDVDAIASALSSEPGLVLIDVIDNEQDWDRRNTGAADALLVACADAADQVLRIIAEEKASHAALPVIVVCSSSPNGSLRSLFEAGADDVVVADDIRLSGHEVRFAIDKAISRRQAPIGEAGAGEIICVLGPKGGTGKTLTASNLAVALALENKRVALVDLDLQFGDLGLVLGLRPDRSIFDLVTAGGSLDTEKLDAFMTSHPSGLRVLLAPPRPDHASAVTTDFLQDLYAVMRQHFDYIVVDTPPGFTPEVITTIDAAASVCLIGTLDAPSLKNAKLGAETLELMGYPRERVRVVLNRADSSVGVSHADVVSVLGRAPDVLVPSNREVVRSVNAGEPIVTSSARSEAAKAFRALARLYVSASEVEQVEPERPRRARGLRVLARS